MSIVVQKTINPWGKISEQGYTKFIEYSTENSIPRTIEQDIKYNHEIFNMKSTEGVYLAYTTTTENRINIDSPRPVVLVSFHDSLELIEYYIMSITMTEIPTERGKVGESREIRLSEYVGNTIKSIKRYPDSSYTWRNIEFKTTGVSLLSIKDNEVILEHEEFPTVEKAYSFRLRCRYI